MAGFGRALRTAGGIADRSRLARAGSLITRGGSPRSACRDPRRPDRIGLRDGAARRRLPARARRCGATRRPPPARTRSRAATIDGSRRRSPDAPRPTALPTIIPRSDRFRARGAGRDSGEVASSHRLPPARPIMKIERIDHLNLTVADIGRSIEFYDRVLGMKAETIGEGRAALLFGQQKIHLDAAGTAMAMTGEKRMPAHICFVTDTPFGEIMAQLERCGVPVRMQGPRAGAIGTIQSAYITDPDDNSIEISTYTA